MTRTWTAVTLAVVGAAAFIGAYLLWGDTSDLELMHAVPPALVALTVAFVAGRDRPVRPVPWAMLALGFIVMTGAAVAHAIDGTDATFPGDREAILVLAYPALLIGMVGLTSPRRRSVDLLGGSEPITYTISATALAWAAISGPYFDGEGFVLAAAVWIWVFPIADAVLALLSLRPTHDGGVTRRAALLASGFAALAAGHALFGLAAHDGGLDTGSLAAAAPMVGAFVLLSGFVAPDTALDAPVSAPLRVHPAQLLGLLVAALVPLGALSLMLATDSASRSSAIAVAAATIAVIVLALVRMWRLVDQVRSLSEQQGRDRLAAMVEHSSDVVVLTDADGLISYVSPGLTSMLGLDEESWNGLHVASVVVEGDRERARERFDLAVARGQGATEEFEASLAHVDGQRRRATVIAANLIGRTAVDGVVVTIRDVTEQRNLERQLSHRAFHDELTGLANRALFLDRMDHALRVERSDVDPVVVLFVDLDDFKSINDQHGHQAGDDALKSVAERIRAVAGSGDTAARLGGDEFAILLEDRGGVDRALDVAERLLAALEEPVTGLQVTVMASIGVAVAAAGMSTTSLLRDADIAMYEAKRAGKGQIRIFDPAMRLVASRQLEYRDDLARAIERGEMRLVFHPYVEMASGQVVGAEALLRWEHPVRGELSPADFVPVAERTGQIVAIGDWVLDRALAEASIWRDDLLVGVNVAPGQLRSGEFVDRAVSLAGRYGVDPERVVFEFNESVWADDDERTADTIFGLRDAGFRFAVDDFGTGACSLAALQRRPVDLLKIDPVAVEDFGERPEGPSLARTILQTASSLGISTMAEGIETQLQLRELRAAGCTFGQGYLLSHPLEADELGRRFGDPDRAPAA